MCLRSGDLEEGQRICSWINNKHIRGRWEEQNKQHSHG